VPRKKKDNVSSFKPRGRRNVIKTNGALPESGSVPEPRTAMPIAEAMNQAIKDLGPLNIDPSRAVNQLTELGGLLEDVRARKAAYEARHEEAQTAKKSWESARELLEYKVKAFTHPAELPLLDAAKVESVDVSAALVPLAESLVGSDTKVGEVAPASTEVF